MGPGLHPQQPHSTAVERTHGGGLKAGAKDEQRISGLSASGGVTPAASSSECKGQKAKEEE